MKEYYTSRVRSSDDFVGGSYKLHKIFDGAYILVAKLKDGGDKAIQSYRYDTEVYSEEQAREMAKDNLGDFKIPTKLSTQYIKEVLKVGNYVYDKKRNKDLIVTEESIDNMIRDTYLAKLKPFIPIDHSMFAAENKGWVAAMWRDDQSMFALMNIIDEDTDEKLEEGILADASVGIVHDYIDAFGNQYDNVVDEISITNTPFIKGMSGYEEYKMSNNYTSKTALSMKTMKAEEIMAKEKLDVTPEIVDEKVELSEDKEEETSIRLVDKISNFFDVTTKLSEANRANEELKTSLSTVTAEIETVKTELSTMKTEMGKLEKEKSTRLWDEVWKSGVRDRKVLPVDEEMYRKEYPEATKLSDKLKDAVVKAEVAKSTPVQKVESDEIDGVKPEVIQFCLNAGMTKEEILEYKDN